VARIQRDAKDVDAVDPFALKESYLVAWVHLPARVVGKAGQHLNLVATARQFTGECQALEGRFRVEPLRDEQNLH
jgi:hypothetical protein